MPVQLYTNHFIIEVHKPVYLYSLNTTPQPLEEQKRRKKERLDTLLSIFPDLKGKVAMQGSQLLAAVGLPKDPRWPFSFKSKIIMLIQFSINTLDNSRSVA